jgi:hypothetical protein
MKKNVLSAFLILFLTTGYTQTIKNDSKKIDWEWAPVGAVWMYQGYDKKWYIKSLKDTLFNGYDCKKLKVEQYSSEYGEYSFDNIIYKYTYNDNDKIYLYKNNIDEFKLIYDYNVILGDTVQLNVPLDACNGFSQYVVDSVINRLPGQWMYNYETNTPIISYHLKPVFGGDSDCGLYYCGYDEGTYLSYTGVTRMYSIMDIEDYYNFRCYYDGNIEIQKSSYIESCKLYYQNNLNISEKDVNPKIKLYPNPVSNMLHIDIKDKSATEVSIYNAIGILVLKKNVEADKYIIDFTEYPSGLYYVTINNSDQLYRKKIIKTKNE